MKLAGRFVALLASLFIWGLIIGFLVRALW